MSHNVRYNRTMTSLSHYQPRRGLSVDRGLGATPLGWEGGQSEDGAYYMAGLLTRPFLAEAPSGGATGSELDDRAQVAARDTDPSADGGAGF